VNVTAAPRPLSELAAHVGGEIEGDRSLLIHGVNGLSEASSGDLAFYGNPRYWPQLKVTRASAVLVPRGQKGGSRPGVAFVQVEAPHLAFARISALFHPVRRHGAGVSAQACVHPLAEVDPTASVMAFVTVEAHAKVGPRAVLYPGVYVGEAARVGADSVLFSNVTLRERCLVGDRVVVHASAVIGADGFGFAFDAAGPAHVKVPQAGIVRIEDDVELGAGTCVDRATTGETVIGRGSKVDNLVQIAHNVRVGPLSLICAQAGVSGSSELGAGVVLAGQVGVVGHIRVGDMAKVGAQSGVAHDVEAGQTVSGSPAMPHREWLKATTATRRLPELLCELRALKGRIEALEQEKEKRG
jgi:UDP-3-O-[3-hydroxymyristoyl] glucosamine N-acyltransferase